MNTNADSSPSIYWHDYETWGANPKKDRPAQFAGIRTDHNLNIIGEPLVIYCQIANDYLPHPEAAMITGITPQKTLKDGFVEAEFMRQIHQQFSQPNTCVAGYNNIRFDDEVTRYALYRNFYDPYGREWQNGNSRWDIIDLVRATYALRPEGIQWPENDDGLPSFRLELLTEANGIEHAAAHDALSDVIATIEMAKLIKNAQPRLFSFLFDLRNKRTVGSQIDVLNMTPVVHVSSKFPSAQGCTSWIAPMSWHPENKNAVICVDLQKDPQQLLDLSAEELRAKLYTRNDELADGEERPGIKLVHINKCPVIAPAKTLLPENAARLGIDREQCLENLKILRQHPELRDKLAEVFNQEDEFEPENNPDYGLYSGGFLSRGDKAKFEIVQNTPVEQLAGLTLDFEDKRFTELLLRYKARNFPGTLTDSEQTYWNQYRKDKLMYGNDSPNLTFDDFGIALENMAHEHQDDEGKMAILKQLYQYAQTV